MSTQTTVVPGIKKIMSLLLGFVALALVASVLIGLNRALGVSDLAAFFVLVLIGLTLCALGKLGEGAMYGWANWRHLAGYLFGGMALLLAAAVLLGWTIPFIASAQAAVLALAAIMFAKTAVAHTYPR